MNLTHTFPFGECHITLISPNEASFSFPISKLNNIAFSGTLYLSRKPSTILWFVDHTITDLSRYCRIKPLPPSTKQKIIDHCIIYLNSILSPSVYKYLELETLISQLARNLSTINYHISVIEETQKQNTDLFSQITSAKNNLFLHLQSLPTQCSQNDYSNSPTTPFTKHQSHIYNHPD